MTEQEFKKQVWRAYDTVDIEGVANHARVIAVGFPSLSVRAAVAPGVVDWFKYDQITGHHSSTGGTDDLEIIENLHNRLMAANKRNEDLQAIVNVQNEKLAGVPKDELKKLRKHVTRLGSSLGAVEQHVKMLDDYLNEHGLPQTEEEV